MPPNQPPQKQKIFTYEQKLAIIKEIEGEKPRPRAYKRTGNMTLATHSETGQ